MATGFSQYHANFLASPGHWYECEKATEKHGNISRQMVCRDVLALIDHVSLLNESQTVDRCPCHCWNAQRGPCQMCEYARLIAAQHSRWRPNAGDHSISLLGFRVRRCSFSGTVAETCAWESRCSLASLRRTVGSGFHLNDHVCISSVCVARRVPATANRLPLVTHHIFVSWNCYATVTDVSQMLWLSLEILITEPRRATRTGKILACLAGTSSIQVITQQQLGVVAFVVFSVSRK